MPELKAQITPIEELPDTLKASMFALYERYYEATAESVFISDLQNKDQVILLTDSQGKLQGFSTLAILFFEFDGTPSRAIFSGDTIVSSRHWGEQTLAFAWIRLAGQIKAQESALPLYWFLIVKGHRTYRYLPAFSKCFYPTWTEPTPPREQALMNQLATMRFGQHYDRERGLVCFPSSRGHLRKEWATVPPKDLRKPEVRFFLERNPGYTRGHELVCLTELHPENLRPLTRRLFLQELLV